MSILQAVNINRSFKSGNTVVNVLKGVSLSTERGKFNVLMGPSGSGKTTLLNILAHWINRIPEA
jgi:ABC-type lipoprotein export system ATPase subunit